jgi:hypothetical protein
MKASFAIMLSVLATGVIVTPAALAVSYGPTGNTTAAGNATGAANATALAGSNATVTVTPPVQAPGGTVLVQADGLAPDANATIIVDRRVAGVSGTDENGTLLYALGVPDEIKITETRVDNSTGKETVKNETHTWAGTVKVVVMDGSGNSGSGELTVLKQVGQSGAAAVASNNTSNNTTNATTAGNTTAAGNMTSSGNATGTNSTRP